MNRETYIHNRAELSKDVKKLSELIGQLNARDVDQAWAIANIMSEINYYASKIASSADVGESAFRTDLKDSDL